MIISETSASVLWLLFLYTLQGVPLGMSAVFPLLLKEKGASYSDLALFSLSAWPFALKLLWAPIVDSTCFPFLGKRKSWLLVSQLSIAVVLYYLAVSYERWLSEGAIGTLTLVFFVLYFLAATQDVAVDGWALTMLPESHVGYAGTCNSVGQTLGYFMAFSGFIALEGMELCELGTFLKFWVVVFLAGTTVVCVFKKEEEDKFKHDSISDVYKKTYKIFHLKSVQLLTLILLSWKLPFNEGLVGIKLQEAGISKETIALFASVTTPVHIFLPWIITKITRRFGDMKVMYWVYPVRVAFSLLSLGLVYWAPTQINNFDLMNTRVFYVSIFFMSLVQAALSQGMFVPQMSFFSAVSDPAIGGTYMTVLNTLSNLGGNIAGQISLRSVDWLARLGIDGFYAASFFGVAFGFVWWILLGDKLLALGRLKPAAWKVKHRKL